MDKHAFGRSLLLASCLIGTTLLSTIAYGNKSVSSFGPTKVDDTLWSVAEAVRPNETVSVPQVVWALFNNNPKAFGLNHDPDNLLKGIQLQVPSIQTIQQVSAPEAKRAIEKARRLVDGKPAAGKQAERKPQSKIIAQPPVGVVKPVMPLTAQEKKAAESPKIRDEDDAIIAIEQEKIPELTQKTLDKQIEQDIVAADKPVVISPERETPETREIPEAKAETPVTKNRTEPLDEEPAVDEQEMVKLQQSVRESVEAAEELENDPILGEQLKEYTQELQAVVKEFPTAASTTH